MPSGKRFPGRHLRRIVDEAAYFASAAFRFSISARMRSSSSFARKFRSCLAVGHGAVDLSAALGNVKLLELKFEFAHLVLIGVKLCLTRGLGFLRGDARFGSLGILSGLHAGGLSLSGGAGRFLLTGFFLHDAGSGVHALRVVVDEVLAHALGSRRKRRRLSGRGGAAGSRQGAEHRSGNDGGISELHDSCTSGSRITCGGTRRGCWAECGLRSAWARRESPCRS